MKFCSFASGSSGNCFYVENRGKSILIDLGISCRNLTNKLLSIGKSPEDIQAVFLTHEHIDHIRGVDVFSSNYNLPIFGTKETLKFVNCKNKEAISSNSLINISGMKIEPFAKSHDAHNPVSYSVSSNKKVSFITDLGIASELVAEHISESNALALESNHDLFMLQNGRYPAFLKKRILSDKGHLSNLSSSLLVLEHSSSKLSNIMLSHLSNNNNTPSLALESFQLLQERKDLHPKISVAPRFFSSEVIEI